MAAMNDLVAVYQMIAVPVVSPTTPLFRGKPSDWLAAMDAKRAKVEKYLAFSAGPS